MRSSLLSRVGSVSVAFVVVLAFMNTAVARPSEANAKDRLYGFSAGASFDLDPADHIGVALGASVSQPVGGLLWARGCLLGMITEDGFAVIPTLSGILAVPFGPFELSVDAGVHIFGVARRQGETIFSIFGIGGGAQFMVVPSERWRIGVRGHLNWLPKELSAPVDDPKVDAKHSFLYLSTVLVVEIRGL
ncbi:MAG: hypothetical protein KAI47_17815 [Deltaproteobacteria bacterium]|nr:hypothetical protein [Deltaproteobacteria bacterium]